MYSRIRRTIRPIIFMSAVLIATSAALAAEAPIIRNGAEPALGLQTLQLEEMWRLGGEDDDETFFGQVVRVLGDESGLTYVLDAQLQQATVYDADGLLVQTLFGQGDGPGEIRRAIDMILLPDGTVGALSRFPAGMVVVERDGTPVRNLSPNERGRGFAAVARGGDNLVVAATVNIPDESDGTHTVRSLLGSLDDEGNRTAEYLHSDRHVDYQNDYVFNEREALPDFLYSFDVGPDGRVYTLADPDQYAISVFSPDGTLERVIERSYTPRQRTAAELRRIDALTTRRFRTFPFDISFVIAETESVIPWYLRGLQVMDNGELWVRHSLSDSDGRVVFDVFDSQGHYDRQVAAAIEGQAAGTGVFPLDDGRLVVVRGFVDSMATVVGGGSGGPQDEGSEPDPIEIICYRILQP